MVEIDKEELNMMIGALGRVMNGCDSLISDMRAVRRKHKEASVEIGRLELQCADKILKPAYAISEALKERAK